MEIIIRKTDEVVKVSAIAKQLPEFFDEKGLSLIERDSKIHILYGAYSKDKIIGFAIYKEINLYTIEMCWLGVLPEMQGKGVGTKLVEESLKEFTHKYKVCEVKTLSETDSYKPYEKTREFYKNLNFIPIETIYPYPNWGDNPCQIFVRFLP